MFHPSGGAAQRLTPWLLPCLALLASCGRGPNPQDAAAGQAAETADRLGSIGTTWSSAAFLAEQSRFRPKAAGFEAVHPLSHLRVDLQGTRTVAQRDGSVPVSIDLVAWGAPDALRPPGPAHLTQGDCDGTGRNDAAGCVRRLHAEVHGLLVWWENRDDGLEQGFTVREDVGDALVLDLGVTGSLAVDESEASWTAEDGTAWRYGGLKAWDHDGDPLPARMSPRAGGLRIEVDTRTADWPVTVDPLLGAPAWTTTGPTDDGYNLGYSLSSLGDVNGDGLTDIAIGRPAISAYDKKGRVDVYYGAVTGFAAAPSWTKEASTKETWFGYVVAGAGDVNGDGFDDLAVGEPSFESCGYYDTGCVSDAGKAHVFYGSASGLATTAAWTADGPTSSDWFGRGLAGAGDVNGDGYDDLAVGAPLAGTNSEGRVYVYHGSASGLPVGATWQWDPDVSYLAAGHRLAGGADFNHDGYHDLVVGSPYDTSGYNDYGRVDVFLGSPLGLVASPSHTLSSTSYGSALGAGLDGQGDVNGDGYDDLVVGAPGKDVGSSYEVGEVQLYLGSAFGLRTTPSWSATGPGYGAFFGHAVILSDTDGDGYDDVVVGADGAGPAGDGQVYVFPGGPTGPGATATWIGPASTQAASFGAALADVGDLNGDGRDDVLVGDPNYYPSYDYSGAAWLYFGADPTTDSDGDGHTLLTDCNDADDRVHPGATEVVADGKDADCDQRELCYLDRDDDGYRRLDGATIVSADLDCTDSDEATATDPATDCNDDDYYIRPGATETTDDGKDSNCDGKESCWVDSDRDGFIHGTGTILSDDADCRDRGEGSKQAQTVLSVTGGGEFGSGVAAGDVNGDGFADLVISDREDDSAGTDRGRLYLYLGSPTGITLQAAWGPTGPDTYSWLGHALVMADFNGDGLADVAAAAPGQSSTTGKVIVYNGTVSGLAASGRTLSAGSYSADFGEALAAGDVNGDGFADLVVGAPDDTNGAETSEGVVRLYLGGAGGLSTSAIWTVDSDQASADFGAGVATGDVDGDGLDDIIVGSPSWNGSGTDNGAVFVFLSGPSGPDTRRDWTWSPDDSDHVGAWLTTGDVNDDGVADVVIADIMWGTSYYEKGRVLVYHGSPRGLPGRADFTVTAEQLSGSLGGLVRVADLNSDDVDDLVIGGLESYYDEVPVTVVSGSPLGLHGVAAYGDGVWYGRAAFGPVQLDGDPQMELVLARTDSVALIDLSNIAWDCDDGDVNVHPAAPDLPGDGYDSNCDTVDACHVDGDGDGSREPTGLAGASSGMGCRGPGEARAAAPLDCDDRHDRVHPGAVETPGDGWDQDCDSTELCFADADQDGQGAMDGSTVISTDLACSDPGEIDDQALLVDCDDTQETVWSGAPETIGDGIDQSCDGAEICFADLDGDGVAGMDTVVSPDLSCSEPGEAASPPPSPDCDDSRADRSPATAEMVDDGVDGDCDGMELCYADADGDGFRTEQLVSTADLTCTSVGLAPARTPTGDCDDSRADRSPGQLDLPGDELDANCDGVELCFADADHDGHRPADGLSAPGSDLACSGPGEAPATLPADDCDDSDDAVHSGAEELPADGRDGDCDGDELCFMDGDEDGHRSVDMSVLASADVLCDGPAEATAGDPADDCDDGDRRTYAGATEVVGDGIDQDCDGEDLATEDPDVESKVAAGCACASAPGGAWTGWVAGLALLALRRRR